MFIEEKKELSMARHGVSGLILLPLLAWFLISLFYIISDPIGYLPVFFYSPVNAIFGIFFIVIILYHLNFDVKYIIEIFNALHKGNISSYILFFRYNLL